MANTTDTPVAPAPVRPKHKGSAQLFKNPVLERLSHTHIALPVSIFVATALVSLYYGITRGFVTGFAGLGLFLAVNVLRTLGGAVSARNRESGGGEVTLTLPIAAIAVPEENA